MLNVLKRLLVLGFVIVVAGLAAGAAGAVIPLADGTWTYFGFGPTGSAATGHPFRFTSTDYAVVTITDFACTGDQFTVSSYDVPGGPLALGTTSPTSRIICDDPVYDPDVAFGQAQYSHGRFVVGPGQHLIYVVADASPWGGGGAYIRYDVLAPEARWSFACHSLLETLSAPRYQGTNQEWLLNPTWEQCFA